MANGKQSDSDGSPESPGSFEAIESKLKEKYVLVGRAVLSTTAIVFAAVSGVGAWQLSRQAAIDAIQGSSGKQALERIEVLKTQAEEHVGKIQAHLERSSLAIELGSEKIDFQASGGLNGWNTASAAAGWTLYRKHIHIPGAAFEGAPVIQVQVTSGGGHTRFPNAFEIKNDGESNEFEMRVDLSRQENVTLSWCAIGKRKAR